ncbi:MAG: S49 family peptidase, partial [Candidatus Binataceae bacterium]
MFRRLFRWLFRLVVLAIVLFIVAVIVDYFTHRVAPGSVLVIQLKGAVVERGGGGVTGLFGAAGTPLNVVRKALNDGANDRRIDGLAIEIFEPRMELAQAQELCAMIRAFASHDKWTAAYLETAGDFGPGNLPYLVASAAQQVAMMPQGELNLVGVGVRELFARGLLDKIGVKPDLYAIGKYKTAANIFTHSDFTPAQHEEDTALVSGMFNQIVGQAASQRRLRPDAIREIVDQAPLTARNGLKLHLVDRLEYQDQFTARIRHHGDRKHALLDYQDYERSWLIPSWRHRTKIAVVYGTGAIESGQGGFDPLLSP